MKFEVYRQSQSSIGLLGQAQVGQWRWRLRATNGRIIANGGESFHKEADCLYSIALVQGTNDKTPILVTSG